MRVIGALFLLLGLGIIYELGIRGDTVGQAWQKVLNFFNVSSSTTTTNKQTQVPMTSSQAHNLQQSQQTYGFTLGGMSGGGFL